jgi:Heterokaryon incompatibility protein (HET)
MNSFRYTPLTPGSSEIRFITLHPGSWDTKIEISLHHDFLDTKPTYEALSYTWGDCNVTRTVALNGTPFEATTNLETALRYLRHENNGTRALWIDALCIDQNNLQEKSDQVKRMREIFPLATKVIAWTGEADEDSEEAMTLMRDISDIMHIDTEDIPEAHEYSSGLFQQLGCDLSTKNWGALWRLWNRPYWSRMWVVQELSCSGEIFLDSDDRCVIRCGHAEVSKSQYVATCSLLVMVQRSSSNFITIGSRMEEPLRTLNSGEAAAKQMFGALVLCHFGTNNNNIDIIHLMHATKAFKASDCRDKLYAIIGLMREDETSIIPDYSKSPEEVFTGLIRFIICNNHNLGSLRGNRFTCNEFGPSWIPELSDPLTSGPAWVNERRVYKASGIARCDVSFGVKNNLLHARGILLGTLSSVIGPFPHNAKPPTAGHAAYVRELHKAEWLVVQNAELNKFGQTIDIGQQEIFWRTLVMDADFKDLDNVIIPAPNEFDIMSKVELGLATPPETIELGLPELERCARFTRPFTTNAGECLANRCFFTTKCGRMGLGPYRSQLGDVVALLYGGDLCFVLRPKGDQYELIGDAYVHGVMHGELFEGSNESHMPDSQVFVLV